MSHPAAPLPSPDVVLALAHAALLDQLDRDDATHAQHQLLARLGQATGARARVHIDTVAQPTQAADGSLWLPLRRLDRALGSLVLWLDGQADPVAMAKALVPVTDTLAALRLRESDHLARDAQDVGSAFSGSRGQLLRAALRGAGTFVWEWHVPSDQLGDIDEGFAQLGYAEVPDRRTQDQWDALIHPDDRQANHEAYLRHARGESDYYEHIYRAKAADGQWRWQHERGRIVEWTPDGEPHRMVGTQVDITERRRVETLASEATERMGKIAAHVPGALFQFEWLEGGAASFSYISERCTALLGVTPEQLRLDALSMLRRVHPDQRDPLLASMRRCAITLAPWTFEFDVRRRDGADRRLRGTASPQRETGGRVLWHGYLEDVTEARAHARAEQDRQIAETANRTKTEFLSRMSHELRTPLNAVMGFAQLMSLDPQAPLTGEQPRRAALIRQAGEHLLAMINDLLDLTSIEAGRLTLQQEAVPLAPLTDDVLALVQSAARRPDLRLSREGGEGVQAWADAKRLRQVLINLLSNATKYNRPGGSVRVQIDTLAGRARLQVIDTGQGLTEDECAHLFEPFNRLRQAHGSVEGTGIGLTVTRGLVTLMGGAITVHSTPGQGSTFGVLLPLPQA